MSRGSDDDQYNINEPWLNPSLNPGREFPGSSSSQGHSAQGNVPSPPLLMLPSNIRDAHHPSSDPFLSPEGTNSGSRSRRGNSQRRNSSPGGSPRDISASPQRPSPSRNYDDQHDMQQPMSYPFPNPRRGSSGSSPSPRSSLLAYLPAPPWLRNNTDAHHPYQSWANTLPSPERGNSGDRRDMQPPMSDPFANPRRGSSGSSSPPRASPLAYLPAPPWLSNDTDAHGPYQPWANTLPSPEINSRSDSPRGNSPIRGSSPDPLPTPQRGNSGSKSPRRRSRRASSPKRSSLPTASPGDDSAFHPRDNSKSHSARRKYPGNHSSAATPSRENSASQRRQSPRACSRQGNSPRRGAGSLQRSALKAVPSVPSNEFRCPHCNNLYEAEKGLRLHLSVSLHHISILPK